MKTAPPTPATTPKRPLKAIATLTSQAHTIPAHASQADASQANASQIHRAESRPTEPLSTSISPSPTPPASSPLLSVPMVIVDDCESFRMGLCSLLAFYNSTASYQFEVMGEAGSVKAAVDCIRQYQPKLVLLDAELAQDRGFEVLQQVRSLPHPPQVLVLSGHQEDEYVFEAMQLGARAYVFKNRLSTQLIKAITTVLKGEVYLSPEVATCFFRKFAALPPVDIHLTQREREVLQCLVQGQSNQGIAHHMHVTVGTVKAYLTAIFEKLEVRSRTQAVLKALELGLL